MNISQIENSWRKFFSITVASFHEIDNVVFNWNDIRGAINHVGSIWECVVYC